MNESFGFLSTTFPGRSLSERGDGIDSDEFLVERVLGLEHHSLLRQVVSCFDAIAASAVPSVRFLQAIVLGQVFSAPSGQMFMGQFWKAYRFVSVRLSLGFSSAECDTAAEREVRLELNVPFEPKCHTFRGR